VSESAVRDKPLLVYGLARNRRSPNRLSEPRSSGVHPEEGAVGRKMRGYLIERSDGYTVHRLVEIGDRRFCRGTLCRI